MNTTAESEDSQDSPFEIELRVLKFLCQSAGDANTCREVIATLREYRFSTMHHQVLFDCLWRLPTSRLEIVTEQLPALLVRAGFPDFNLRDFLTGSIPTAAEAREDCRLLLEYKASGSCE